MATPGHDTGARYRGLWGKTNLRTVTQDEREDRHENATEIADAFYDLVTDHYQSGWGPRFHFCGFAPHESWDTAQARHEHYLALMTNIKPGMKVLDVGCGIGCPMREIAIFTGAHVTGININRMHLARAKHYSRTYWGLADDQVEFVYGDFMKMPFADDSFDVVYAMEALCHAPDMAEAYTEVKRVLKPGGYFAFYEHIMTPEYDDSDPEHRRIRSQIEYGAGVPNYSNAKTLVKTLKTIGWDVLHDEDRALAKVNTVPWW